MAVSERCEGLGHQEGDLAKGQRFEGLGFTWCKIGSIALIAVFPKPALILASVLAIYFYARAMLLGVDRSCCILRHPLLIIAFWGVVLAVTLGSMVWPLVPRSVPGRAASMAQPLPARAGSLPASPSASISPRS